MLVEAGSERWSGHRLAKAMNPGRRYNGPLRKLRGAACEERSRYGALNSVKPLKSLHNALPLHLPYNTQNTSSSSELGSTAGRIANAPTQQTLVALQGSALDSFMRSQHMGAYKPG